MGVLEHHAQYSVLFLFRSVKAYLKARKIPAAASRLLDVKMSYPWPLLDPDPVLEEALNIALDYLAATGQAKIRDSTRNLVVPA